MRGLFVWVLSVSLCGVLACCEDEELALLRVEQEEEIKTLEAQLSAKYAELKENEIEDPSAKIEEAKRALQGIEEEIAQADELIATLRVEWALLEKDKKKVGEDFAAYQKKYAFSP